MHESCDDRIRELQAEVTDWETVALGEKDRREKVEVENKRLRKATRVFFLEWDDQHEEDIAVDPEIFDAITKLRYAFGQGHERRDAQNTLIVRKR